jgi:hypothetical protein
MHFHHGTVMRGEQGFRKQGDRVLAEIGGNVTNAQSSVRRPIEVEVTPRGHQWLGMLNVPTAVLGKNFLSRYVNTIVEAK